MIDETPDLLIGNLKRRREPVVGYGGVDDSKTAANIAKDASRLAGSLEKQYVSRLSRFQNSRCVPFSFSTRLVHIRAPFVFAQLAV